MIANWRLPVAKEEDVDEPVFNRQLAIGNR